MFLINEQNEKRIFPENADKEFDIAQKILNKVYNFTIHHFCKLYISAYIIHYIFLY